MVQTATSRPVVVSHLPTEIYLETTNRCNLACRTCPQYYGMPEASADLSLEQVQRLLDQLPVVRRVVLHGIGEPLLNRSLPEIVRAAKARGARVLFNSNGLLLKGRILRPLIESGLDELRVSVDSAEPETYEAIRGVDGLERIFTNLSGFAGTKRSLQSETPAVSLWITGMKQNVRELPDLVQRAAGMGITEVYLQRLVFSGKGSAVEEQALFRRADSDDLAAVTEAQTLAKTLGVRLRGSGEASAAASLTEAEADVPYQACRRPWSLMYVTANGNVLPCCIAPFTEMPYDDMVLGNVFEEKLEDVWNGPRYQDWRRRMLGDRPPPACAGCGSNWSL
jgi:radical SAM protein with 4Fe4S-binding SPASM domain